MQALVWFELPQRGVLEVAGEDRVRWLNGMVSNEVAELAGEANGCRALLLSRQGRVLADFHVLALGERIWLELEASFIASVSEQMERYIIADDVSLLDLSGSWRRYALEGEVAVASFERCSGERLPAQLYAGKEVRVGEVPCVAAHYGFGSKPGVQLFVEAKHATALREAVLGFDPPPEQGSAESFELMRVLAGLPRLGAELDESVLPDEARLEDAISTTKGCYTGQEVIARLRSRGRIKHRLVGLAFEGSVQAGDSLSKADKKVGEVTSVVSSESHGSIGLGFVKLEDSEAGTALSANGAAVEVVDLPFPGSAQA